VTHHIISALILSRDIAELIMCLAYGSDAIHPLATPRHGSGETMEHLQALLKQEVQVYSPPCRDYLNNLATASFATSDAGEAWRRKLCEWCYEVADHFDFDRDVVSYALSYIDRMVASETESATFISSTSTPATAVTKRRLQLIAVTSLYLAIKVHGEISQGTRRKLGINVFVELGRKYFSSEEIVAMERNILCTLEWKVNPPTCQRWLLPLLELCPSWQHPDPLHRSSVIGGIYDVARYLTELSVCVSTFSFTFPCSATALAAIVCAMEAVRSKLPLPSEIRGQFLLTVEVCTGLTVLDGHVKRADHLLKRLCPAVFEAADGGETDQALDTLAAEIAEARASASEKSHSDECTTKQCVAAGCSNARNVSPVSLLDEFHQASSPSKAQSERREDDHWEADCATRSVRKRFRSY
jgi:lipoyl(octanoyl) transferase